MVFMVTQKKHASHEKWENHAKPWLLYYSKTMVTFSWGCYFYCITAAVVLLAAALCWWIFFYQTGVKIQKWNKWVVFGMWTWPCLGVRQNKYILHLSQHSHTPEALDRKPQGTVVNLLQVHIWTVWVNSHAPSSTLTRVYRVTSVKTSLFLLNLRFDSQTPIHQYIRTVYTYFNCTLPADGSIA